MTDTQTCDDHHGHAVDGFRHEAFFYDGPDDFVLGVATFVEAGLRAREPVMVVLVPERLELLRQALGPDATGVRYADMGDIGHNPARIIPAWQRFVDEHVGVPRLRGVGEPIWPDRGADELSECQRHEALLNVAFEGGRPWALLCPYASELGEGVLGEARRSHPVVVHHGSAQASADFVAHPDVFDGPLPEPGLVDGELAFDAAALCRVRAAVSDWATVIVGAPRAADLALAVHEVAANSVRHGGGCGRLRYWHSGLGAVVEVRDSGRFETLLVGRRQPSLTDEMGRGLWLAQHLCDLVQLRSSPAGSTVRLHVAG